MALQYSTRTINVDLVDLQIEYYRADLGASIPHDPN